jgi:hypothetical protein
VRLPTIPSIEVRKWQTSKQNKTGPRETGRSKAGDARKAAVVVAIVATGGRAAAVIAAATVVDARVATAETVGIAADASKVRPKSTSTNS